LGGGYKPPILGKRPYGVGDGSFERALASSYMPSIVMGVFLYLYAFQGYCRFCAPYNEVYIIKVMKQTTETERRINI